ncbi:MAG: DNA-formamidopyrimidine glycosylase family protein [Steroidobacteraceae bacterium]
MPEGPSLILAREQMLRFEGRKILHASGNAKIDMARVAGRKLAAVRTWGKHLLLELPDTAVRVHFLMFGSYTVDTRKDREPRLQLRFQRGELNFYSCAIRLVEGDLSDTYDWTADVMSGTWDPAIARRKLRKMPETLICDALLDQTVFAGVGNIIKNEVLFRVRVHPLSTVGALPPARLRAVVEQARQYSFEFLAWRRDNVLRKHWQVHNKGTCPQCGAKLTRAWLGTTDRRSFFCEHCQQRYGSVREPAGARRPSKSARKKKST